MAKHRAGRALRKRVNKGFIGHPLATVIFYGPTDKKATKLVVGIFRDEDADLDPMRKWISTSDVRDDPAIVREMLDFLRQHGVKSVSMPERIVGCPHEEGTDYPEGQQCQNPRVHLLDRPRPLERRDGELRRRPTRGGRHPYQLSSTFAVAQVR